MALKHSELNSPFKFQRNIYIKGILPSSTKTALGWGEVKQTKGTGCIGTALAGAVCYTAREKKK